MTISINYIKKKAYIQEFIDRNPKVFLIERGDEFSFGDNLQIELSQDNQYINFLFIVKRKNEIDPIKETFSVNKFEIAEQYRLDSPTVLNSINFCLYLNGYNVFETPTKTREIFIYDAVYERVIDTTFSSVGLDTFLLLNIHNLINKIISTSVWKLVNKN